MLAFFHSMLTTYLAEDAEAHDAVVHRGVQELADLRGVRGLIKMVNEGMKERGGRINYDRQSHPSCVYV